MHIAICDSNIADRKQMERLLERESDKRKQDTGVLYIDSFGSKDALLECPLVYDCYYLDFPSPPFSAYDMARTLRDKGIVSPIVFCISTMDYRECGELLPNTIFIDKPILVKDLSDSLDKALSLKNELYVPKIELRNTKETFYLLEEDVLYAEGRDNTILVYMKDGSVKPAVGFIDNLWQNLLPFKTFSPVNKTTIVNTRYVSEITAFHVRLCDETSIRLQQKFKRSLHAIISNNRP